MNICTKLKSLANAMEMKLFGAIKYYRRRGARIGHCPVFSRPSLAEPHLCEIGNNVWITAGCMLQNHDGGIAMLNRAGQTAAVNIVGKIVIHDNVFIGTRSLIMGDVEIGPNAIVAAGSVVTKDVAPGMVVGGNPAKPICTVAEYIEKYNEEPMRLHIEKESEIQTAVTNYFMKEGHRGKKAIYLRQGKSSLTT